MAKRLELSDFKASNGWLENGRPDITFKKMIISGESGEVSDKTVESWKERLPEIVDGYKARGHLEHGRNWMLLEGIT